MAKIDVPQGTLELLILTILNREPLHRWNRVTMLIANVLESA